MLGRMIEKSLLIRLPADVHQQLRIRAILNNVSASELVRQAIEFACPDIHASRSLAPGIFVSGHSPDDKVKN